MAMVIRAELFQPGLQLVDPVFFNSLTTVHGLVMVFGVIMPAFVGFANWLVPMQIGAADMAFPRMNNWSFWLLIPAGLLLMSSFLVPGGAAGSGWTDRLIVPPYTFRGLDGLVTNFHLPRSSLLFLVSALAGRDAVLAAYRRAIDEGFRFYSYGDAMFVA